MKLEKFAGKCALERYRAEFFDRLEFGAGLFLRGSKYTNEI